MISIIIPTFNQLSFTRLCLQYLEEYTKGPYEVIIVDNGSTDGTVEFLQGCPELQLINFPQNRGFPAACNAGLKAAKGRYIVLLNNDILVTPNWLTNLTRVLDSRPDVGMVLPVNNLTYGPQILQVYYHNLHSMIRFARQYNRSNPSRWLEILRLPDYCLLIRRELMDKIGYLDEGFFPGYYEDDDYSYRARQAGYRLILANDTFVHHFSGVTTSTVDTKKMGEKNLSHFVRKWQIKPFEFFQLWLRVINPLPDGLLFNWGKQLYLFQSGSLRMVSSPQWHPLLGLFQKKISSIVTDICSLYPMGPTLDESPFPEGILLASQEDDQPYIIHAKQKRPVKDPSLLKPLLNRISQRKITYPGPQILESLPEGPEFNFAADSGLPGGLLLRCGHDYYVTSEQMLRPLSLASARRWGYSLEDALPLDQQLLDDFAFGPPVLDYGGIPLDFPILNIVTDAARKYNRRLAESCNLSYTEEYKP